MILAGLFVAFGSVLRAGHGGGDGQAANDAKCCFHSCRFLGSYVVR